ncbi:hypothetical protein B0I35DRAFT_445036 [Stachybotrys elegans]|uniref:Uncharacterized protein n=1 Tax=Stachybotrys elegans TaxID=80388 RepID=A0A8K0SDJ8_9HYPO|nr:hypothetical protein B0I35DRAFT_445036 [Stachybotrys elegans]
MLVSQRGAGWRPACSLVNTGAGKAGRTPPPLRSCLLGGSRDFAVISTPRSSLTEGH